MQKPCFSWLRDNSFRGADKKEEERDGQKRKKKQEEWQIRAVSACFVSGRKSRKNGKGEGRYSREKKVGKSAEEALKRGWEMKNGFVQSVLESEVFDMIPKYVKKW